MIEQANKDEDEHQPPDPGKVKIRSAIAELIRIYAVAEMEARASQLRKKIDQECGEESPYWSMSEVTDYLDLNSLAVEREILDGRINPVRVGNQRKFEEEHIRAYARENMR